MFPIGVQYHAPTLVKKPVLHSASFLSCNALAVGRTIGGVAPPSQAINGTMAMVIAIVLRFRSWCSCRRELQPVASGEGGCGDMNGEESLSSSADESRSRGRRQSIVDVSDFIERWRWSYLRCAMCDVWCCVWWLVWCGVSLLRWILELCSHFLSRLLVSTYGVWETTWDSYRMCVYRTTQRVFHNMWMTLLCTHT